jgi:hypothetical protein
MTEEIGALAGAQFRTHALVLWCDGYRPSPGTFQKNKGVSKFALALLTTPLSVLVPHFESRPAQLLPDRPIDPIGCDV